MFDSVRQRRDLVSAASDWLKLTVIFVVSMTGLVGLLGRGPET